MQQDDNNLLDFVIEIDLEWLMLGENRTKEIQKRNNGVLKTLMYVLFL